MRQELSIVCWARMLSYKGVSVQPCMGVLNSVALSLQLMMVSALPKEKRIKKLTSKYTHQQDKVDVEQYPTSACIYYVPLQQPPPAGKQRKGIQE